MTPGASFVDSGIEKGKENDLYSASHRNLEIERMIVVAMSRLDRSDYDTISSTKYSWSKMPYMKGLNEFVMGGYRDLLDRANQGASHMHLGNNPYLFIRNNY